MRVEEIALRQEIRQMLVEAGYNKNTLKDLVKSVMQEELKKAIDQAIHETHLDLDAWLKENLTATINRSVDAVVKERITSRLINRYFDKMEVSVKVSPIMDEEEMN